MMEQTLNKKYYLSTDGFYFIYREDKYNSEMLRAILFDSKHRQHDNIRVQYSGEFGGHVNKSHTDVINTFESMITLSGLEDEKD